MESSTVSRLTKFASTLQRFSFLVLVASATQAAIAEDAKTEVVDRKSNAAARARGDINFDDLKFPIEKDGAFDKGLLTDDVKDLVGRKVKLRGFILPSSVFTQTGISQFVLVRDNQECCFGPGAALYDCVVVDLKPGATADFVTRPIVVKGKFSIDTKSYKYPEGFGPGEATHQAIFHIEADSAE